MELQLSSECGHKKAVCRAFNALSNEERDCMENIGDTTLKLGEAVLRCPGPDSQGDCQLEMIHPIILGPDEL